MSTSNPNKTDEQVFDEMWDISNQSIKENENFVGKRITAISVAMLTLLFGMFEYGLLDKVNQMYDYLFIIAVISAFISLALYIFKPIIMIHNRRKLQVWLAEYREDKRKKGEGFNSEELRKKEQEAMSLEVVGLQIHPLEKICLFFLLIAITSPFIILLDGWIDSNWEKAVFCLIITALLYIIFEVCFPPCKTVAGNSGDSQ